MEIKKLILIDGKLYLLSPYGKAEVGDISQCKYTGKYEVITDDNIQYMTGYHLWKPVDLCLELSNEQGLTYKANIKSAKTRYDIEAN